MVVAVDCPNMEVDEEAARAEGWPKMEPEAEEADCPKTEVDEEACWPKRDPELAGALVLPKTELGVLAAVAPNIPPAAGLMGEEAEAEAPNILAVEAGVCPNTLG